ncbi:Ionotropic receptor 210, partial [Hyalella azteca]
LSRMVEAGLIGKWKSVEVKKVAQRSAGRSYEDTRAGVLTLNHLQGAFIVYVIGGICATIAIIVEVLWVKINRHFEHQKTIRKSC